jgi:hypothetical protein
MLFASSAEGDGRRWTSLTKLKLNRCESSTQRYSLKIVDVLDAISRLRESADFELYSLREKQDGLLQEVANDQIKAIAAVIAQLELEAVKLKDEIAELAGTSDTP